MNLLQTALSDGEKLTADGTKYVTLTNLHGTIYMDIGLVRIDGVREIPHATRKYYERDGKVFFITYPHP